MKIICSVCKSSITEATDQKKFFHQQEVNNFFCGIDCFEEKLLSLKRRKLYGGGIQDNHKDYHNQRTRKYNWVHRTPFERTNPHCWNQDLRFWFHSTYEADFAVWATKKGYVLLYEPIFFYVGSTVILPDFYFPEFDCFVETKGPWASGAKKKWSEFRLLYPKVKIFLLTWNVRSSLERSVCQSGK